MSIGDWLPWVRRRQTDELSDEIRAHLEMAAADRVARGESLAEAAANARREFGNPDVVVEVSRDEWGGAGLWIEHFAQDTRIALRMMRRTPGFTAICVLTIAIGVGATAAIFGAVDATLIHPLPYPHPEQLVRIEDDLPGIGARDVGISIPEWLDLQRSGIFEHVSPTWFDDNNLTGVSRARRIGLLTVAPNYFALLDVKPQLGATFDPVDPAPGYNGQVVISDALWRDAFGGDPHVIGRVVQVDSDSYSIIGVMPKGFQAPGATALERRTEVWPAMGFVGAPLTTSPNRAGIHVPSAIGRLRGGMTIDEAQRKIDLLVASLSREYPADYPPQNQWRIRLVPLRDSIVGDVRQSLLFLFAAVALVLVIGCANVANLLLARANARGREMALRQALGGASARLTRQLFTESVILSLVGGVVGLGVLFGTKGFLLQLIPPGLPRLNDIEVNWTVVLFAFGTALVTGIAFGLAPAFQLRSLDMTRALKQEGRGSTGSRSRARTRRLLVVGEFALSVVLMITAVLLLRSYQSVANAPMGFDTRGVTIARTRMPYPNDSTEDLYKTPVQQAPFFRELARRMNAIPGVQEATVVGSAAVPLDHPEQDQSRLRVIIEDRISDGLRFVNGAAVTPEYFHLLGVGLVHGRMLSSADDEHAPLAAVVNESFARRFWPNEDPIGKRVKTSRDASQWTTVVGIVTDARTESLDVTGVPVVYSSVYQKSSKHIAIFLRGRPVSASLAEQIESEVHAMNPALPVFGVTALDDTVARSLDVRRFSMRMIALFALTGLLLAGLGVYGVISYMVTERTQEIGIRMAMGAQRSEVLRLVLRQAFALAALGAVVGVSLGVVVSYSISNVLYGVSPTDPVTFGFVAGTMALVALAAAYVPARRAIRVDPMEAVRG